MTICFPWSLQGRGPDLQLSSYLPITLLTSSPLPWNCQRPNRSLKLMVIQVKTSVSLEPEKSHRKLEGQARVRLVLHPKPALKIKLQTSFKDSIRYHLRALLSDDYIIADKDSINLSLDLPCAREFAGPSMHLSVRWMLQTVAWPFKTLLSAGLTWERENWPPIPL